MHLFEEGLTAKMARSLLSSIDPALRPGRVRDMQQVIAEAVPHPALRTRLLGAFAGLSLLLAVIGLYGLMAQSVIQRTQEIGVRVALGAQTADLVRLVVGQRLRLAAIAIATGVLLAPVHNPDSRQPSLRSEADRWPL